MQRAMICGLAAVALTRLAMGAEEQPFSKAVSAADYPAAGLNKLSPQELARLDALVRDYKSGVLEAARREAAAAAAARSEAEARAAKAEAQVRVGENEARKPDRGLLTRAKVLLTPGTEIEYTTIESRIAGNFVGWDGRTLFTLENGQRWQSESGFYVTTPVSGPAVKIVPGVLGSFWMTVEGVKPRVKVKFISDAK